MNVFEHNFVKYDTLQRNDRFLGQSVSKMETKTINHFTICHLIVFLTIKMKEKRMNI